jgi:hypothetical protein
MKMKFLLMFLFGGVISTTVQKSSVNAVVGFKNHVSFVILDKTANLFSKLQGQGSVSALHQRMNYSSL